MLSRITKLFYVLLDRGNHGINTEWILWTSSPNNKDISIKSGKCLHRSVSNMLILFDPRCFLIRLFWFSFFFVFSVFFVFFVFFVWFSICSSHYLQSKRDWFQWSTLQYFGRGGGNKKCYREEIEIGVFYQRYINVAIYFGPALLGWAPPGPQ